VAPGHPGECASGVRRHPAGHRCRHRGEIIDVGFGSHSYLNYMQANGDARNVAAKFYPGDPGGPLNPAGVGIIKDTDNAAAANAFIDFMLLPATQQYLADDGFEIPVVEGAEPPEGMPTAAELTVPGLDMREYEELQRARQLLTDVGIIMGPGQR
jgi:iron(III) transport system substrate-binding protein